MINRVNGYIYIAFEKVQVFLQNNTRHKTLI